jgi:hypothetical protein
VYSAVVFCVISERRLFLYTELIYVFFVTEAGCVYCSVRTESFNVVYFNFGEYKFFFNPAFQTQNSTKMLVFYPLPHTPTVHFPSSCLLQFQTFYLATCLSFLEGRTGRAEEIAENPSFLTPLPRRNVIMCVLSLSLLLLLSLLSLSPPPPPSPKF